jgi:sulfur relay (sulfurtransferase) DsrF/TusC family protein
LRRAAFVFEVADVGKEAANVALVGFVGAVSGVADAAEERTYLFLREDLAAAARRQLPEELLGAAFVDFLAVTRV